ncbi:MAG: RNA polymerase sigma factor [Planctomycetota bacterium]
MPAASVSGPKATSAGAGGPQVPGAATDEELMLQCRGAPPDLAGRLIGELARRHMERLATFIFGLTGDRSGALDLAQEAFVRVFKHRESYREIARFSTWLYTIGRNLALNEVRNRRRRPSPMGHAGADGAGSGEWDPLGGLASGAPDPATAAQTSDLRAQVRAAIEELPEHYRAVVILCDLQERPYAEAAAILEVPVGTIRSRLSRARAQLAGLLEGALEEGP